MKVKLYYLSTDEEGPVCFFLSTDEEALWEYFLSTDEEGPVLMFSVNR